VHCSSQLLHTLLLGPSLLGVLLSDTALTSAYGSCAVVPFMAVLWVSSGCTVDVLDP
jgi:hypothetical protein